MAVEKRQNPNGFLLLLLSLHALNHIDDYSGTLEGVRKRRKKNPHFSSGHKSLTCCIVSSAFSKNKKTKQKNYLTGQ